MHPTRLLLLALAVTTLSACGGGTAHPTPAPSGQPGPTSPGTGQPAPTPNPVPAPAPGAYTMTGRVMAEWGEPLAGVDVYVQHTESRTYTKGVTDAQGRYVVPIPQEAGLWSAVAYRIMTYSSRDIPVYLAPEDTTPFSSSKGAVRDFVYRVKDAPHGRVIDEIDSLDVEIDYDTLEVTFTPDGPNTANRSEPFTLRYRFGYGLPNIPLGEYFVTATQMRSGQREPLLIATRDTPTYVSRARARFLPETMHVLAMELFWKNP
ncbi:carboxypeptidase-like regulatory domain-containing protein [Deinococcus humi]|uniref:Carboxypeptidase regulatory-like domain-containing protein n=1 Tax=Deinococcus humi TaxID=662880 RepID=A0A7W8JX29_9DEIO|nr:carboxypeptidase-like regulatory domain-containing protein [Deinococcus humi]MBB5363513.1 hypothetical protein [Deinococcus humi]GGO30430.1 hypothetical protein GCM10008949_25290 [Deinococcus humi]